MVAVPASILHGRVTNLEPQREEIINPSEYPTLKQWSVVRGQVSVLHTEIMFKRCP
jgi:hypothetical protein